MWTQPLAPVHSLGLSAAIAAIPLIVVLTIMGALRRSGLLACGCGLAAALVLAIGVWTMPAALAGWSLVYGFAFALWSILWLIFNALWLYALSIDTGSFELLRRWIERHASGDATIQATLVAFCFGALLEGNAGFGAPVAITAFLLIRLGFEARAAVLVSLIANTAPVAFGGVGAPIVALAGVTGLDLMKLSAAVGRQLPLLSVLLPAYLVWVVSGWTGVRRSWVVAFVAGASFAVTQLFVSNVWGPYATDTVSASVSIVVTTLVLRARSGRREATGRLEGAASIETMTARETVQAWFPWATLSLVVVLWSYFNLFPRGQTPVPIPMLHNGVQIALYGRPYAAVFTFQPLAAGTAVLVANLISALRFGVPPAAFLRTGVRTLRQLRVPGLTVLIIVGLAFLYNYSGMTYTLGAALAGVGVIFPFVSSYLGWLACFLTGSDTSSNLLFGNLQVAAARQLHLNPVLLAATNSSGAVTGKMISPQNIAIGVTTAGLVGREGEVLRGAFWHSLAFAAFLGLVACAQAYVVPWMMP